MTEILFVTSSDTIELRYEVNGTLLLATKLLHMGFATDVLRFGQNKTYNKDYSAFVKSFTAEVLSRKPRCVSFYTLWPYYHVMLRIAFEIKKERPGTVIIFGGPQASTTAIATMEAAEFVDYICTGEGENTVVPFFDAILRKGNEDISKIPGLYYRYEGNIKYNGEKVPLCDLNTLPYWDERLLVKKVERNICSDLYFMPIDAGRGCPFNCTFCNASRLLHRTYRLKTPERIIEDILYYNKRFGIRSFNFSHDAFTTNQKLVEQICDKIIDTGLDIKWKCTARINCITEELALKMKRAGMTHIEFGIETGSQRMQKLINKKLDLEHVMDIISFLLKNDISVALFFMYGFPEETEQDLEQTLEMQFLLLDMGVQHTSMSFCRFNPGTVLTEKYQQDLIFDSRIKTLSRDIFGYSEEKYIIKENKAIFPFFFHLPTPVRNEYQYLSYFVYLYKQFPNTARYVRKLYGGENLRFYKDFCRNNQSYLENMDMRSKCFREDAWKLMDNTLRDWTIPYIRQLKGILKFDNALCFISRAKEDMQIKDTYDFSYLDYRAKRPIEEYSMSKTEILLQKTNGKLSMRILNMQ